MCGAEPEAREMTYTRIHSAPRELVFACLTTPEHLTHFWGPAGTTAPVASIIVDLRPGGHFDAVIVNDDDGSQFATHAVFVEVSAPEKLVWRELGPGAGMTTTVTLDDLGDGRTRVVTHQTDMPPDYLNAQARAGYATSLDRFSAYLEGLQTKGN